LGINVADRKSSVPCTQFNYRRKDDVGGYKLPVADGRPPGFTSTYISKIIDHRSIYNRRGSTLFSYNSYGHFPVHKLVLPEITEELPKIVSQATNQALGLTGAIVTVSTPYNESSWRAMIFLVASSLYSVFLLFSIHCSCTSRRGLFLFVNQLYEIYIQYTNSLKSNKASRQGVFR
jgi:hypothetical protein